MTFFLSLFFTCCTFSLFAQQDTGLPPYQRYPTVPGLQLLRTDSTKYTKEDLPKQKPLLLLLFSPDCDHCQHEAEQLAANKEAFQNMHIVLVSTYPLYRLKEFAAKYGLDQMQNVVMTKDPYYLLVAFYAVRNLPYRALYDKKGKLIRTFEGSVEMEKVIAAFDTH